MELTHKAQAKIIKCSNSQFGERCYRFNIFNHALPPGFKNKVGSKVCHLNVTPTD